MSQVEECQSTPALLESGMQPQVSSSSLGMIAEHGLLESCTRLSISLEQNGLFQVRIFASLFFFYTVGGRHFLYYKKKWINSNAIAKYSNIEKVRCLSLCGVKNCTAD